MITVIDIDKIKEEQDIHYYYASDISDINYPCNFYIGIDPKNNCIYYYYTDDFSKPVWICNLNNPDELLPKIQGLDRKSTSIVLSQAIRAIEKNEFPPHIGRYS